MWWPLMSPLRFLEDELNELGRNGLRRVPDARGEGLIDFCSNDYLGYGRAPVSRATLLECEGAPHGAGASRLIYGTQPEHLELERELADWVSLPAALLFSSGYAANVGLLRALVGPSDTIVSDALNHASLIDGCRLSRANVRIVPHLDLDSVRRQLGAVVGGRAWVVTESYFSMDGDQPDLCALRAICDTHDAALIVDEAHALGVFGPEGGGVCRQQGIVPDALIGTLGKAVGVQGAFVAGSAVLREWLWNRARSLVYSTAPAPVVAHLARTNVSRARRDDDGRERLHRAAERLAKRLRAAGFQCAPGAAGPIVPLLVGDNEQAVALATSARAAGFRVQAIRPPTVPPGSARLRLTVSANTLDEEIDRLSECLSTKSKESSSSAPELASARPT